jgi:hypothetical protein
MPLAQCNQHRPLDRQMRRVLILIHSRQRPDRWLLLRRLATMPSRPMTHAWRNTTAPSTSSMSLVEPNAGPGIS